jgi:hypothetical protein
MMVQFASEYQVVANPEPAGALQSTLIQEFALFH